MGQLAIEGAGALVRESELPSRQGRVALAMLVAEHLRPVGRDELAEELWGDSPPDSWERALSAIVSKLRSALTRVGLPKDALAASFGAYQLRLPGSCWIDLEGAEDGLHEAEARLRAGDAVGAYAGAHAAAYIYQRPFLLGADGPWVRHKRAQIQAAHLRACDAAGTVCCEVGELDLAVSYGERAVALDPFRESGWRLIMRAHARRGSRAEGLRAYERCRKTLAEELGIDPSPETEEVYLAMLGPPRRI